MNIISQEASESTSLESPKANISERYAASMVLSGVGDALGFRNCRWEFCRSGQTIHKELEGLGGLANINVSGEEK